MNAKILIVDDELAIRKLLARYLEDSGYECHTAESVASAKKILASETFDLLLCDLKMPGESGLDLIRYAKEHYPQTGRVMVTAFGSPELANQILNVGVYGYIIKPTTKDIVLITVENALRHLRLDLHMHACKIEMEKAISHRTEKLAAIMDNLNVGIVMLDSDMKILELNRKMQQWFPEVSTETAIPCYDAFNSPPGNKDVCAACPMAATLQTGKTGEITKSYLTEQGERDFRIVTSPVIDKSGSIYAGIALYEDVTEKILLERDLRQAQKLEAVGQLAAGIAHEINSPIQFIGDNISFLKDSFDDIAGVLNTYEHLWHTLTESGAVPVEIDRQLSEKVKSADIAYLWEEIPKTIDQSLDGVQRVEKIVRAMKEFSHPGSDEKTTVDINKILENTITVCRNEWKYVAEMETDFAPDLPLVPAIPILMEQVTRDLRFSLYLDPATTWNVA